MIKLKYADNRNLETVFAEVLKQIEDREYAEGLKRRGVKLVIEYGMLFCKKECMVVIAWGDEFPVLKDKIICTNRYLKPSTLLRKQNYNKNFFVVRVKWEEKNEGFKRNLKKIQSENSIRFKTDIVDSCSGSLSRQKIPASELYHIYKPDDVGNFIL